MRFVPLEEVEKQQQAPQLKFVPLEEANKQPQESKFVPVEATPVEPSNAPGVSTVVNPFNPIAAPEEKGFFSRNIDWAGDALRSGWENIVSSVEGLKQSEASEFVARLEEKYGPGAVNAPPDKKQLYKEAVDLASQSMAERRRIAEEQQKRYELNPQREATREFKAAITGFDEDKLSFLDSAAKAGQALLSNPVGVIADLGLESTPASIAMLASAILVRFGGGTSLAAAGVGGASSAVTEFGNEYAARIDKGIPHDKAWQDAATKSGVIGFLDAVSMNSAGKAAGVVMDALTGTRRLGKAALEVGKETGKQALLGAAGEAGGSLAIGEVPNPAGVLAEAVGEVFGAPLEAIGTYRALKPTPESREAAALRGLDELANEEEAKANAAAKAAEAKPVARTLDDLSEKEVDAVQRRLYAELGRPAEEQELLEALNEYVAEQNASLGVESGAGVAGVSDTGAKQPAGPAGISDTGAAATPDTGGLGVSGVPTDQLEDRTEEQQLALDEAGNTYDQLHDEANAAYGEYQTALAAYEALTENTPEDEQAEIYHAYRRAREKFMEASAQAKAAHEELMALYDSLKTPEQIAAESTEGAPSQEDIEAAKPKSEEVLDEYELAAQEEAKYAKQEAEHQALKDHINQVIRGNIDTALATVDDYGSEEEAIEAHRGNVYDTLDEQGIRLDDFFHRYIANQFDRLLEEARQTTKKQTAPATDIAALEAEERARNDELRRIEGEQKALLTKAGRKPAKNSPARKKYDELEKQRIEAYWNWAASEKKLMDAKTAQETGVNIDQVIAEHAQEFIDTYPDSDYEVADYDAQVTKLKSALRNLGITDGKILTGAAVKFDEVLMSKEGEALEPKEGGGIFKSLSSSLATAVSPLIGILPLNKFGINRLNKLFSDGAITAQEYAERMTKLFEDMEDKAAKQAMTQGLNRQRGLGAVIKALEDAVKKGRISRKTADFAIWLLNKNPAIANDLAISISMPKSARAKAASEGVAGFYNDMARLVRLITKRDPNTGNYYATDPLVAVHEILHHMERMLPNELRALIRNEWRVQLKKALDKASKTSDQHLIQYLTLVTYGNTAQSSAALSAAENMIKEGTVDKAFYSLMNPSEFWAVNGADILFSRYGAKTRFEKLRQYLKEFIEAIKNIFGLESNDPIIKGLNAVLEGDEKRIKQVQKEENMSYDDAYAEVQKQKKQEFKKRQMLAEGPVGIYPSLSPRGWESVGTDVGEEERKLNEQFARRGDLAPSVVEAIKNDDLNGALKLLADGMTGFYGELAARLLDLNLQTSISFDTGSQIAQRAIDKLVGPQVGRIMSYLRVSNPEFYDQFFKDYDKAENIPRVATGMAVLNLQAVGKGTMINTAPIANEIRDAFAVYKQMSDVPLAPGVYFNTFDTISLNTKRMYGIGNRVFLHEVVHAATVSLLRADPSQLTPEQLAAREEIVKLYNLAKDNIKVKEYGFTNVSEFIAELFTNETFRNRLKAIPYPAANTNVLSRFIRTIFKLFGFNNLASRAMVEAEKLFTATRYQETMPMGPLFAQAPKKPRGKGPITSSWRPVEDLKKNVLNSRPEWKSALNTIRDRIWDPAFATGRRIKLGAAELRHLSDMAGTKFPLIGASVRIIEKMISHRGKIMTDAASIAKDWMAAQKKNLPKSQLLGRVMLEATLNGVEVDPSNTRYYDATKVDQRVKDAWNALGPEFQSIYRRVRDFYQKQMQDAIQIMRDRANLIVDPEQRQKMLDNIDKDFGPDKLIYPYFPLKRFGKYWFQVGSGRFKEFYTFESMGERNTALRKRQAELAKGNATQRALAENIELGDSVSTLLTQVSDTSNILKTVNELIDSLPDKFTDLQDQDTIENTLGDVQKELREEINQLLYTLMPEQSMRKQMITRKSVQGASADMLRVFTNSATRLAYQQARARYSPQYIANLNNARSFIKDMKDVTTPEQRRVYRDFLHEMERRYKPMLGMEDTDTSAKVAGLLSDLITTVMMSAPMSAFLNTAGYFQFAATQLGGRYGYIKATDRMWENFKTYGASTVQRTLTPLVNGQMMSVHFPSAMESGKLTGLDKVAAQQLIDEEQVNVSQTYDMVSVGDRPSDLSLSKYEAIKRAVFMPLHQIERFNREIGLLTAFQLEYEKLMSEPIRDSSGIIVRDAQGNPEKYQNDATTPDGVPYSTEAYDRALTHAKDMVAITLGETTRQMRPRYFMNALLALPLKLKRYMITALYSMWSNFDQGFIEPFKDAEIEQMRKALEANKEPPDVIEQKIKDMEEFRAELSKEGRKALAGAMFNTFLLGGTAALPFYTTIFPLIVGMFTSDDDDDEFFDFDNWYRNYMEKEFGGYVSGLLVAAGVDKAKAEKIGRSIGEMMVVGPATKLTGGSLSERVSLDIKSMAFRDMRYSPSARATMQEAISMAVGPLAGLVLSEAEAYDLWKQGQYGRALERGLPAVIAKPITALRYALEGATTKRGDELVSDLTGTEIAMQAIGLSPYRVTKAQRQSIQVIQKVQKIEHKRNDLMNNMWMKYSEGDADGLTAAYLKAEEFSSRYPTYRITPKMITDSFQKRAKDQAMADAFGARVDKKSLPIALPMLNKD